jgi:hypothetical protein
LKDLVAGKRPAGVAGKGLGSLAAKRATTANKNNNANTTNTGRQAVFPAKLQYGSDTRSISLSPAMTYSELLASTKEVFPAAYPFALKYLDKEGDLVTITQKGDLQMAMGQSYETAQRSAGNRALTAANLPPVRIQVVKVASEAEVPKAPMEENRQLQNYVEQLQRMQLMQQQQRQQQQLQQQQQQGAEVQDFQVDPWILKFVDLFREHCGIDPDRPLEAAEIGTSKLNAAFQEMMDDPKSEELLGEAEDKFQEQVASAMICQAAVHHYRAEKLMFAAAKAGKPATDIAKDVEKHLKKAEEQCKAACTYRPAFFDTYLTEASIAQTRAKLAANYLVEPAPPAAAGKEDITDPAERAAAEDKESKELLKKALARVTPASSKSADKYFEAAYAHIQKAIDNLSKEDATKEIKPLKPSAEQDPADPEDQPSVKATLMIQLGNAYYEHSVVRAGGGGDWKSMVLKSKELFEKSGAHPSDIRTALQGHVMAEELSDIIGPEVEAEDVEMEAEPAAAANGKEATAAAAAVAPKGLPSLSKKK